MMKKYHNRKIDIEGMRVALLTMLHERDVGDQTRPAIARRLAHIRDCAQVNQAAMAEQVGVTSGTWKNYEQGRSSPDANTLQALLSLGINPTWVLTGTGPVLADDETSEVVSERGSAGECPAPFHSAKTPAAGAQCYRVAGVAMQQDDGTLSLCVSLQRPGGGVG